MHRNPYRPNPIGTDTGLPLYRPGTFGTAPQEHQLPLLLVEERPATPAELIYFGRLADPILRGRRGRSKRRGEVAALVTPPLCLMGETPAPKTDVF